MSDVAFDLLIVGAGPAGSATALGALAADPCARVGLVDRAAFPRDKVCGDGLTPTAVSVLGELGVDGVLDGWAPVSRLTAVGPSSGQLTAGLSEPAYGWAFTAGDGNVKAATVADLALGDDDTGAWASVAVAALGQRLRDGLPSGRHHQMQGGRTPDDGHDRSHPWLTRQEPRCPS